MGVLKRVANYLAHCRLQEGKDSPIQALSTLNASLFPYQKLKEISVRHYGRPADALKAGKQFLASMILNGIDPFSYQKDGLNEEEEQVRLALIESSLGALEGEISVYRELAQSGATTSFEIPILQRDGTHHETGKTQIDSWATLERHLSRLRILEKNKVRVAVVGPANSGKSTLTASLFVEVNNLIAQVQNNLNFADLILTCGYIDLDPQSHDVDDILHEKGTVDSSKVAWSDSLALATARDFIVKTKNITIGNAPGGPPDKITETVIGPTDLTILLIAAEDDESWQRQHEQWGNSLRRIGRTQAVLLRSRRLGEKSKHTGEPLESMITFFRWKKADAFFGEQRWIEQVGGRVVGLAREVVEDDPCISSLAHLLLFDLLPQAVLARKRQTQRRLSMLLEEQKALQVFENIRTRGRGRVEANSIR